MNYIDKVKKIFFTDSDLGIRSLDPDFKEKFAHERVIQDGAQSQLLMANPIFQDVVANMYLSLESQLDFIEDTEKDADERVRWVRLQRRALRTITAILDNNIAAMESLQNAQKENQDGES